MTLVTILLLLLFFVGIAFFAACAGAYFGLDRVARARLEHEAEGARNGHGLADLLKSPRTLRGALEFLGDASRVGFCITSVALQEIVAPVPADTVGGRLAFLIIETYVLTFFVGELTARTLAARHAEAVTRVLGRPLRAMLAVTAPLRALANGLLPRRARLTAANRGSETSRESSGGIDEEEFRELVAESTQAGVVHAQEQALIHKILDFGDRRVRDVMTPFDRIFSLSEEAPVAEVGPAIADRKYSRIPVHRQDARKIVGVVYAKDLLPIHWGVAPTKPMKALMRRPLYVVPQMRAQALLESFKRHRLHMGIVVDEDGMAVGLCTMEDLLEELVGPITDVAAERKGEESGP